MGFFFLSAPYVSQRAVMFVAIHTFQVSPLRSAFTFNLTSRIINGGLGSASNFFLVRFALALLQTFADWISGV